MMLAMGLVLKDWNIDSRDGDIARTTVSRRESNMRVKLTITTMVIGGSDFGCGIRAIACFITLLDEIVEMWKGNGVGEKEMEKEKKECMVCFLSRGFVSLHILASDTDWMRLAGGWIGRSYSSFDFIRAFLFQWIFGLIFLCMSPYTVLCRWKAYFSKRSTSPIVVRLKFKAIS